MKLFDGKSTFYQNCISIINVYLPVQIYTFELFTIYVLNSTITLIYIIIKSPASNVAIRRTRYRYRRKSKHSISFSLLCANV